MNAAGRPKRRLLLDSHLVLLLCVGSAGAGKIHRHKRLRDFDQTDFELLVDRIGRFDQLVITPNIATETSNLLRFGVHDEALQQALAEALAAWSEAYVPSRIAAQHRSYPRLGISDAAMLVHLSQSDDLLLLTADLDLYLAALRNGLAVENFNHTRSARPDFN